MRRLTAVCPFLYPLKGHDAPGEMRKRENAESDTAISAFVDLYMAVYPSFVLFRLQMSLRKKIALSITLGLGTLAAACAIAKCTQIEGLANQSDATCRDILALDMYDDIMWTTLTQRCYRRYGSAGDLDQVCLSFHTLDDILEYIPELTNPTASKQMSLSSPPASQSCTRSLKWSPEDEHSHPPDPAPRTTTRVTTPMGARSTAAAAAVLLSPKTRRLRPR